MEHISLVEKVIVLIFDGLDVKRYNQYKEKLISFSSLSVNNFPVFVEAPDKEGFMTSGTKAFLGIHDPKFQLKKFDNFASRRY